MKVSLIMWFSSSAWVSVDRTTLSLWNCSVKISQQSTFYKDCKLKLVPGEMLVTADFSENPSFRLRTTLMLASCAISDCLHHDCLFQKALLRRVLPTRTQPRTASKNRFFWWSQYKNRKNFVNLCHHKDNFGISAEWHFSASLWC